MTPNRHKTVVNVNVTPQAQPIPSSSSTLLAPKSAGVAVALCLFGGCLGLHRFYLNRSHAITMLILSVCGVATFGITWFVSLVWAVIDLFQISGWATEHNAQLAVSSVSIPSSTVASTLLPAATNPQDLESRLLLAAQERGGTLTVTQGVVATQEPFGEVEKCLRDMVAAGYVDVDNLPDSGMVVYKFGEL